MTTPTELIAITKETAAIGGVSLMFLTSYVYRFIRNMKADSVHDKLLAGMQGEISILRKNNETLYEENKQSSRMIGELTATVKFQSSQLMNIQERNEKLEARIEEVYGQIGNIVSMCGEVLTNVKDTCESVNKLLEKDNAE